MKRILLFVVLILVILSSEFKAQTDYYLRTTGNPVSLTSWVTDPTGVAIGTIGVNSPSSFNTANIVWHFKNRAGVTNLLGHMLTNTVAPSPATVIIEPGFNLNFNNSVARITTVKLDITNTGTLTISQTANLSFTFGTLDANSAVVYSVPSAIKVAPYGNLVVSASSSLISNTSAAKLTINTGAILNLNSNGLTLNGSNGLVTGPGTISGNNFSYIELYNGNGGNNGTLNFTTGSNTLDMLYLQLNGPSDYISLGSDLNISFGGLGTFYHLLGSLNLNGKNLIIDNTADFSPAITPLDGLIMGSNSSGIFINGTVGGFTGSFDLFMDPSNNTLKVLSLNSANLLNAGNALNIADSLSVRNGGTFGTNSNVTLISTQALKGRLGNMNTGTITGNLKVQTFARGGITDWVNIGVSGVTGETINSGWYGQIPMAIEGSTTGVTSVANTYFESVQRWNEAISYYDTLVTVSDPLVPGVGYWVYLGNSITTTSDMVWTVNGTAVQGTQPITLTKGAATTTAGPAGWNLISNPFPSPIDWNSVIASNPTAAVNDAYYVYDPDLGNTVSFVNGIASPASGTLTNYQTMADIIPMGQAFYVEVTALGSTVLNFNEGNKSANNTSNFQLLKSNQSASIGSPIRLNIDGGGYHDDAVIRFHSNATPTFDKALDARKWYSSPGYAGYPGNWTLRTVIATQSNNEDYSINSLPYAQTQNAVIPVIARVYSTGQYTISGTDLQNLPPNSCVTLKDKLLNVTQDLRLGNYICTISDTTYASRFELTVCADITADVKSNTAIEAASAITINKDAQGIFVDFDFKNATKANITVTNILGQRIMDTKKVKVTNDNVYLDLNVNDQLIFVTVETENEKVTKKFLNFR
jgi:hypothetical protein